MTSLGNRLWLPRHNQAPCYHVSAEAIPWMIRLCFSTAESPSSCASNSEAARVVPAPSAPSLSCRGYRNLASCARQGLRNSCSSSASLSAHLRALRGPMATVYTPSITCPTILLTRSHVYCRCHASSRPWPRAAAARSATVSVVGSLRRADSTALAPLASLSFHQAEPTALAT